MLRISSFGFRAWFYLGSSASTPSISLKISASSYVLWPLTATRQEDAIGEGVHRRQFGVPFEEPAFGAAAPVEHAPQALGFGVRFQAQHQLAFGGAGGVDEPFDFEGVSDLGPAVAEVEPEANRFCTIEPEGQEATQVPQPLQSASLIAVFLRPSSKAMAV